MGEGQWLLISQNVFFEKSHPTVLYMGVLEGAMSNGRREPSSAKNLSLIIIPRGSSTANIGEGMRMRMRMILQGKPRPGPRTKILECLSFTNEQLVVVVDIESIFEGFKSYEWEKAGEAVVASLEGIMTKRKRKWIPAGQLYYFVASLERIIVKRGSASGSGPANYIIL